MRVIFYKSSAEKYLPEDGGVQRISWVLAEELKKQQVDVVFVTC